MAQDDEHDRNAIMTRRRRFIAIALAGMSTTACDGVMPTACLEPPVVEESAATPCLQKQVEMSPVEEPLEESPQDHAEAEGDAVEAESSELVEEPAGPGEPRKPRRGQMMVAQPPPTVCLSPLVCLWYKPEE